MHLYCFKHELLKLLTKKHYIYLWACIYESSQGKHHAACNSLTLYLMFVIWALVLRHLHKFCIIHDKVFQKIILLSDTFSLEIFIKCEFTLHENVTTLKHPKLSPLWVRRSLAGKSVHEGTWRYSWQQECSGEDRILRPAWASPRAAQARLIIPTVSTAGTHGFANTMENHSFYYIDAYHLTDIRLGTLSNFCITDIMVP